MSRRWGARPAWAAVAGLAAQLACSTVPPPVVSPASQAGLHTALTWSVDWGYARAHIQRPDGSIQAISGNGDSSYGDPDREDTQLTLPIPALVSLHHSHDTWDTGEYLGWRRFGVTARVRLSAAENGALTSLSSSLNAHWSLQGVDAGIAIEQSLPVASFMTLLGRVGVSYGLRDYDIELPHDLDGTGFRDNTITAPPHFDVLRPDLRVEPVIGVVLGTETLLVLSFQPYFVVARGSISRVHCDNCVPDVRLVDFTQDVGVAVALTLHGR